MMRIVLTILAFTFCVGLATAASAQSSTGAGYNLPDLGNPADTAMSPDKARRLGAQIVTRLRARGQIIANPELEEYIRNIGNRLVRHTDSSTKDFHFYIINSNDINAFALPGGYIGINSGLIVATSSASELASVMAHEIAHVTQRHIARQAAESRGDTIATMAAAIVAAIASSQAGGGGDAATAAIMGGLSHLGMQQLSYTRAHEAEADRVGIGILARSGFNPQAMVNFFVKLERHSDLYGMNRIPQILLSHPVTSTRIAEAKARVANYGHVNVHTSPEYPYIRVKAQVATARDRAHVRDIFQRKLQGSHVSPADRYGYALALSNLGQQSRQAIDIMQTGLRKHPNVLAWRMGLAKVLEQAGQPSRAEGILAKALKRFPQSEALKLAYAENLEDQGKPGQMRQFMLSKANLLKNYPEAQKLLARGAGKQKRIGEAYYRQARYFGMIGNYPQAINQLRTALQTANLSSYDQARLKALRRQMVAACNKTWSASECRRGVIQNATHY